MAQKKGFTKEGQIKTDKRIYGYKLDVGKNIDIHFLDSTKMTAKLLFVGKYEIYVEKEGKEISLFKNAIKYIVTDLHS